jgi:hypothetical protein
MDHIGVMSAAQMVSAVLSSLKNARDLATVTSNSELREQINSAYDGLIDIKERLLNVDEENRALKTALAKKAEVTALPHRSATSL